MSFPGQIMQRCWHLVDARNQTVGRLATQVASILMGKHKPTYKFGKDMGDYVVIINADSVHLTGKKWNTKLYRWHTGYPGGLKTRTAVQMMDRQPTYIIRKAILGMIKNTSLRHQCIEPRLKIYPSSTHPHIAQLDPTKVEPLPKTTRKYQQSFGFGIKYYAHPNSYQPGIGKPNM
jgi:large subunit ribosomal protein L13